LYILFKSNVTLSTIMSCCHVAKCAIREYNERSTSKTLVSSIFTVQVEQKEEIGQKLNRFIMQ
jgi:hypothetical protein